MARAFMIKQLDCTKCCRRVRARVPVDDSSPQLCPDYGTELMLIGTLPLATHADEGWREYQTRAAGWNRQAAANERSLLASRLFRIDSDYQVGECADGYDAIGCGDEVAKGRLTTTPAI